MYQLAPKPSYMIELPLCTNGPIVIWSGCPWLNSPWTRMLVEEFLVTVPNLKSKVLTSISLSTWSMVRNERNGV